MRPFVGIAALFNLCLAATPTVAAEPRTPAGKWGLEFAEHQCFAIREYRAGGESIFLGLKPSPTGKLMQIIVMIKERAPAAAKDEPVTVQIDSLPPIDTRFLSFGTAKGTRQIDINLPIETFAPMRQATRLSIVSKGDVEESFVLTQMPALMAVMDRCLLDLQQVWNVGEAAEARLQARAKTNLAPYFSSKDYPAIALRKGKDGTVEFAMLVNESGRVADCMVTMTSGVPVLDAQVCAVVRQRARFTPAIGADGKPAKDSGTSRVKWVMGRGGPMGGMRID